MITYGRLFPDGSVVHRAAAVAVLVAAFAGISPAWPDQPTACVTIDTLLQTTSLTYGAFDGPTLIGWIGATEAYHGNTWELHPIAVHPAYQHCGVGTTLIAQIADFLVKSGATTLLAWCDDEVGTTSLFSQNRYPEPLSHLHTLRSSSRHAGGFYLRCGFALSGVIPYAHGRGKHDFLYTRQLTN